jgi:hypothetical protein
MAILVFLFSGLWPYAKTVLLFLCWVLPRVLLPVHSRELILMALDALGKWSLIDAFMSVSMVISFRMRAVFPHHSPLVTTSLVTGVVVEIIYGLSSFLLATIISLFLSHVSVALHRHAESPPQKRNDWNTVSVATCFFRKQKERWVGYLFTFGVPVLLFATLLLLSVGTYANSFRFVFGGAAGFALDVLGISRESTYSLLTFATSLPRHEPPHTLPAVYFVETLFILTVIVVPVVHIIVLALLWLLPMRRKCLRRLFIAAEVLNAWSAIETVKVYILIVVVMLFQIQQFAGFVTQNVCKLFQPILDDYFAPLLGEGNTSCFEVQAYLLPGMGWFFVASLMYLASSWVVMRSSHRLLKERERSEIHGITSTPGLKKLLG